MHSATVLPLHGGHAPKWLFGRMVRLSRAISDVIIDEFGPDELVRRLSDKDWFQALACTIGYDWHSSGTTTVTVGALKEALAGSTDIFIAGGKGKEGLKTPEQIGAGAELLNVSSEEVRFRELSRLAAKVDSALVYDDIGIYHHAFIFTRNRKWAVVQQAMHPQSSNAIRFQWFSDNVNANDVASEPHTGIQTKLKLNSMDLTCARNSWAREGMKDALSEYERVASKSLYPSRHEIVPRIDMSRRAIDTIQRATELDPRDFRELLLVKGMGRATVRSLALVASLIYDRELAYRDPVMYAYNLGGKDGIPFPVPRKTYDNVVESMQQIIDQARLEGKDKYLALKRLSAAVSSG